MHELSIAISMVDEITEQSRSRGGLSIVAVHLLLGQLSGVDKAALTFCYAAACDGTLLDGSKLMIEEVPVVLYCSACSLESRAESIQRLSCPRCHCPAEVIGGHELEIASLEILE
jgi:hydrogenase nickel incorporation protein HypA/HybF